MPVKAKRTFVGKSKWVRVGNAFNIEGKQINVVLDALPVWKDWDGTVVVFPAEVEEVDE
jgi:hypothetical protein